MKDLSLHILDIVQNSISAGALSIGIEINEDLQANTYTIIITDDGRGMDAQTLERVSDPYFTTRTTRKVGLGIPLFRQNAERTAGSFAIESQVGKGTKVTALFVHENIDRPPLGDMAGVMVILAGANPGIHFCYVHRRDNEQYVFDTREVEQALDGVPLNEAQVMRYLKEMIKENLASIKAI